MEDPNLIPIGGRALVKSLPNEVVDPQVLKLPPSDKEPIIGIVMANDERGKYNLNIGDKVVYVKGAGTDVKIGSRTYLLINQTDILGIIE